MSERWISLHVFHRGDDDLLITHAVGPLVRTLEEERRLAGFFFLRYWEGGPHIRLRLLPASSGAPVERRARTALEAHLRAHPSAAPLDEERYALLAERYARAELMEDTYDRRVRGHDCVEAVPYRPELDVFGGQEATRAAEEHFTDASRIALATLGPRPARGRLLGLGTALLMLTLAAWEPDLNRAGLLLAERRERWDTPRERESLAAVLAGQCERLTAQALRCWHPVTGEAPQDDPLTAWSHSIGALRKRLAALQTAGLFRPKRTATSFHGARADDVLGVLMRCAHLMCNRLGITTAEEVQLRYLVGAVLTERANQSCPAPPGTVSRSATTTRTRTD
ncbi:lantibiotic dehydratase C-terminal domain-containing protein [Streptosporangium sp. NPDC051022]|uniref:lantibiotic dehydratase C-terminal domain-containing protein n=1 Tax=Streptosporangium sp. NPDC051022 TaxID=3155752 RepID=UPI0034265A22